MEFETAGHGIWKSGARNWQQGAELAAGRRIGSRAQNWQQGVELAAGRGIGYSRAQNWK